MSAASSVEPGPPHLTSDALAALPGVRHGFFGRRGGVSRGIYESLNCGPGSKDEATAVARNRAKVAAVFGLAPGRLLSAYQVHSARAEVVSAPWADGAAEVDGLVTTTPGLVVSALAADCAPVLLADAEARVVAAAHAGWKGALSGITDATLAAMEAQGAARERVVAAVGPCIAQAAYEVGPEYEARFVEADAANARFFASGYGDRRHFDLKAYVADRLARAGVAAVDVLPACTCAEEAAWFSHRRGVKQGESDYGRNISVIALGE